MWEELHENFILSSKQPNDNNDEKEDDDEDDEEGENEGQGDDDGQRQFGRIEKEKIILKVEKEKSFIS